MTPTLPAAPGFVEEVEIHGHIIDSLLLPKVLDEILTRGGAYTIKDVRIGQRQEDPSHASIASVRRGLSIRPEGAVVRVVYNAQAALHQLGRGHDS